MMQAYDHGVVTVEDRRRAARCEMLDELEEFVLLMRHYCLAVGVSTSKRGRDHENEDARRECVGYKLCEVGKDSPVGFQEGRCTAMNRHR